MLWGGGVREQLSIGFLLPEIFVFCQMSRTIFIFANFKSFCKKSKQIFSVMPNHIRNRGGHLGGAKGAVAPKYWRSMVFCSKTMEGVMSSY